MIRFLGNEHNVAALKACISLMVLAALISGVGKQEPESSTIPIYIYDFPENQVESQTNALPQPLPKPKSAPKIKEQNPAAFFAKAVDNANAIEKTPIPKEEGMPSSESSKNTSESSQNAIKATSSSESFSSYYSKADYHYEEAERLIKRPRLISKGTFLYPQKAVDRNIEGVFKARLWVDTKGKVIRIKVLDVDDTFGFESAIKQMAMNFQYEPVIVKGMPIAFTIVIPFEFSLE